MNCKVNLILLGCIFGFAAVLLTGCDKKDTENTQQSPTKTVNTQKQAGVETALKDTQTKTTEQKLAPLPTDDLVNVKLETSMGDIILELDQKNAPVTVKNFLTYANEGFYDGTVFHRVIKNFMIQGGGFDQAFKEKPTKKPIVNEAKNGLKNNKGTIAMARTNNPDSATAQFFINHKDNSFLNYAGPAKPGYAVFGKVVQGMDVLEKIASAGTGIKQGQALLPNGTYQKVPFKDVPNDNIVIKSAKIIK